MKIRLYKRFVKIVCKSLGISKKQLFSRDFAECVFPCYKFDFVAWELARDDTKLIIISHHHPLSQYWKGVDCHSKWLFKHWKHSHWKHYVQTNIDLGRKEDDVLKEILQRSDTMLSTSKE